MRLQDPNDLSFSPGDIIEIVAEDNEDWWKGRINGREGLFPSNYVEKLATPATSTRVGVAPPPQYDQHVAPLREKTPYRAFGAAHSATDKPPPPGSGQLNSVGLQQADGQEKKKSKYGKLGNTVRKLASIEQRTYRFVCILQLLDGKFGCGRSWIRCRYVFTA